MTDHPKLVAARKTGNLARIVGALREIDAESASKQTANTRREQLDPVDAAIRIVGSGLPAAEQRALLLKTQPGTTVSAEGVNPTKGPKKDAPPDLSQLSAEHLDDLANPPELPEDLTDMDFDEDEDFVEEDELLEYTEPMPWEYR